MSTSVSSEADLQGVVNPDFLAIGLGGTNMMSMLWAVATGRRAVGVEMRGDPFLGVHWNIRADLYHQLGLIDKLMLDRYGDQRIPRRGLSDKRFSLAETLYSLETRSGDIVADEVIDGFDTEQHIAGTIHHVEFVDDRWRDGVPHRTVTLLTPPKPPDAPDPTRIRTNMVEVLDGPSTFQAGAASVLVLLRRYLEKMERLDLENGFEPRLRLFTRHRILNTPDGFVKLDDGRIGFRIEALQELDYKGKFVRIRRPGTHVIDIGVPELFMIAEGFHSTDAERLGFEQHDVVVDHKDGRGPVVAQADFLAGLIEVLVGGRLRRRISSEFDADGTEYWVRQIAVGHENDPEVGWCLVQVPDYKSFDPIKAGLLPEDTDPQSPEYFAAYNTLVYEFYVQHVGAILELPKEEVAKIQMAYGPKLFTLVERMGDDALLAANGVVAGDSFGNGHFLTSGGAMTGMVGHSARAYEYFQARDAGVPHGRAIRKLADGIKADTHAWLQVSAREYSEAVPINFGAERIAQIERQSGINSSARAAAIDATRRQRHALLPLDPSDWRRLFLRNGMVYSAPLPELHAVHPLLRDRQRQGGARRVKAVFVAPDVDANAMRLLEGALAQPGVSVGLVTGQPIESLPDKLHRRLAAAACQPDIRNPRLIAETIRRVNQQLGPVDRVLATVDDVQPAVAAARGLLGIEGDTGAVAHDLQQISRMRAKLVQAGVATPRFALIESIEDGMLFGTELGYFPLVVTPNDTARSRDPRHMYRVDSEDALRQLLERLQPTAERPLVCEEFIDGQVYTLEVISVGDVPAWFSATRIERRTAPEPFLSVALPREADDPADPLLRRMGFAAIKAVGLGTGLASITWSRRPDGSCVISTVSASPPGAERMLLMSLAHHANMYRVWANVVLTGQFTPIPRLYAAGAISFPNHGSAAPAVASVLDDLGELVVRVEQSATAGGMDAAIVRHQETRVVDDALRRIATVVRASGDPAATRA